MWKSFNIDMFVRVVMIVIDFMVAGITMFILKRRK